MKRLVDCLVDKRYIFSVVVLFLAVLSIYLYGKVDVITDLTKYISDDSRMKKGMDIMYDEFGELPATHTIRVMFKNLSDDEKEEVLGKLEKIEYVQSVSHVTGSDFYENGEYTLYVVNVAYDFETKEMDSVIKTLDKKFVKRYDCEYSLDVAGAVIPPKVVVVTVVVLLVILLIMCESYFEPILFLGNAAVGILINAGSNYIFGSVSVTTFTISGILQMVLSMDYTLMLSEKYRQKLSAGCEKKEAMKLAISESVRPISGSAFTTAAGLVALVFMNFKIGIDMGRVLAKGVFVSYLCTFMLFPSVMLICSNIVEKTRKKRLFVRGKGLALMEYRCRYLILPLFVVGLILLTIFKSGTELTYFMYLDNEVNRIFPQSEQMVILYSNQDEAGGKKLTDQLKMYDGVDNVVDFEGTLNKAYTAKEFVRLIESFGIEARKYETLIKLMYYEYYNPDNDKSALGTVFLGLKEYDDSWTMEPMQVLDFVRTEIVGSDRYSNYIDDETLKQLEFASDTLKDGRSILRGENYSRIILDSRLLGGTDGMEKLLDYIYEECDKQLDDEYYVLGYVPLQRENEAGFSKELSRITLITVITVFMIVLVVFRSVTIPVLLVGVIQAAVYATMGVLGITGENIYYLALLMVQCILMGATIDYGILFTTNYKRARMECSVRDALIKSYDSSLETILTSGLIMVLVTGAVGIAYDDATVAALCQIVSVGAGIAVILVIGILPGVLAALDRLVSGKRE